MLIMLEMLQYSIWNDYITIFYNIELKKIKFINNNLKKNDINIEKIKRKM